jgi:hypothetical protein
VLRGAGLDGSVVARADGAVLLDVRGYLEDDSAPLMAVRVALGAKSVTVIGAYAKPVSVRGETA